MPSQALRIGQLFANVGRQALGGQSAFDQGQNAMAKTLMEQEMMGARTRASDAQAGYNTARTDEIKRRARYQTPEYGNKVAATLAGLTDPQAAELETYQKQGNWGMTPGYSLPDELAGPRTPDTPIAAPAWATPETLQRFNQVRGAHMAALGATGDTNGEQIAKALEIFAKRGDVDRTIVNPGNAGNVGQAYAAVEGKPLFHQGANGTMQLFTGQEQLNDVGRSAAKENIAKAAQAYAAANNQNATAKLHEAQIPEVQSRIDLNKSKIGAPVVNPDGSITTPKGKPIKLSATAEKELFEADDNIQAAKNVIGILEEALSLNDKAYSGYGAKMRATLRSNLPGESEAANATINLDNMMTGQALESLKMIFGGMPTEGERKILLEMQASADKTTQQRKDIINRAIKLAKTRAVVNTNKANALRSGTYNVADPQGAGGVDINALLDKYGG